LGYLQNAGQEGPSLGLSRNGEPFFLATRTEAEARRRLCWGVLGGLGFGVLLFAAGILLFSSPF
jgi:hypothetical protein